MEVKIINTKVQVLGDNSIGFEQDNLMNRLSVITDRGNQWKYSLLVFMVSNNKGNVISLVRDSDTELHVEFTKEMLPVNGRYVMQFEYTDGNIIGHTDKFDAYVKDVINLEDTWVGAPSEFEQLRQEVMQNAVIAQNAANEARQISQEIKVEVDKAVEASNKAQQNAQQVEQAVKLVQEAQRLAQQASEVAQLAKDQAVLSANEAERSAVQANQSKLEAADSATQASQSAIQASQSTAQANISKDEAKKAQLASEKARDESQAILEQIQGIKTEVDDVVAQINDARDKALQAIETNKNSAVESVNNAGATNISNVNKAGTTQTKAVNDAGAEQVLAVTNEGNKQVGLVTNEGTKQLQSITAEGSNQVKKVSDEGTKQVGLVNTVGQEQVKAVNDSGVIQTANAKEQADKAKTEADRAESVVANKLDKPTTQPVVGQILKVQQINPDGTFVVGWADDGGGTVQDVQIDGKTIVQDGVANVQLSSGLTHNNALGIATPTPEQISGRNPAVAITGAALDSGVKAAMCDGVGPAWTATEQAAARDRMKSCIANSTTVEIANITTSEEVAQVEIPISVMEYKRIFAEVITPKIETAEQQLILSCVTNTTSKRELIRVPVGAIGKSIRYTYFDWVVNPPVSVTANVNTQVITAGTYNLTNTQMRSAKVYQSEVIKVMFSSSLGAGTIPAGTNVTIFAVE